MLAEELSVLDADAPLWNAARSLLDIAFRLEQNAETYSWHGWNKQQIDHFLQHLPAHCTLLVGVWETITDEEASEAVIPDREALVLGFVGEVVRGEVCSLRTFEALNDASLPSVQALEPGFEHARELMRSVKAQIANHRLAPLGQAAFLTARRTMTNMDVQLKAEWSERALRMELTEDDRYRSVFENALEGIFQMTPDGRYLGANPALARIFGFDSSEELQERLSAPGTNFYVKPERRREFHRLMSEAGVVSGLESEVYRRDGSTIWISENAVSVRDERGRVICYEGFVVDIFTCCVSCKNFLYSCI